MATDHGDTKMMEMTTLSTAHHAVGGDGGSPAPSFGHMSTGFASTSSPLLHVPAASGNSDWATAVVGHEPGAVAVRIVGSQSWYSPGDVFCARIEVQAAPISDNTTGTAAQMAWISAQLHGHLLLEALSAEVFHGSVVGMRKPTTSDTELPDMAHLGGTKGVCLYAAKPAVVAVDVVLKPGEQRTYLYQVAIPYNIPPSFRGGTCRVVHCLTVGSQRMHGKSKMVNYTVPVYARGHGGPPSRPMYVGQLNDMDALNASCKAQDLSEQFVTAHQVTDALAELQAAPLHILTPLPEEFVSAASADAFSIDCAGVHLCTVLLRRAWVCAGEMIPLHLDFSKAQLQCWQVSVALEQRELLPGKHSESKHSHEVPTVVNATRLLTAHLIETDIMLHCPAESPPSISSHLLDISWSLVFEFETREAPTGATFTTTASTDIRALSVLKWRVPIIVAPRPDTCESSTTPSDAAYPWWLCTSDKSSRLL